MLSLNVTALGLVAFMCTFRPGGSEALRDDVLSSSMFKMCSFGCFRSAIFGNKSILSADVLQIS